MKHLRRRFLAAIVCFTMVVSVLSQGTAAYAAEDTAEEYQIYPIPHEITYQEGTYEISSNVNVVYESAIDDVTKNRMSDVLAIKDAAVTVSDQKKDGMTNILVGVYGSDEYVDNYVEENYSIDTEVYEKNSAHYVISADNEIVVLGADTDAAFYGITSLKHIFNQMEDNRTVTLLSKTMRIPRSVALSKVTMEFHGLTKTVCL